LELEQFSAPPPKNAAQAAMTQLKMKNDTRASFPISGQQVTIWRELTVLAGTTTRTQRLILNS
jgi:hypothetical protein